MKKRQNAWDILERSGEGPMNATSEVSGTGDDVLPTTVSFQSLEAS
jgi:hypothetical protein